MAHLAQHKNEVPEGAGVRHVRALHDEDQGGLQRGLLRRAPALAAATLTGPGGTRSGGRRRRLAVHVTQHTSPGLVLVPCGQRLGSEAVWGEGVGLLGEG